MRLIQGIESYERQGRFAPWLFKLAANVCRNHQRSTGRRRQREILAGTPESAANPAHEAEERDTVDRLRHIIDSLPEQHSVPLWLKYQQGLDNDEIAQVLDIPPSSVRVVLFRALVQLRERASSGKRSP